MIASNPSDVIQSPHPALTQNGFFRLSVGDYHDMIRNNILTTEDRVELLDGYLVLKMPRNSPHMSSITRLMTLLVRVLAVQWHVRVQGPITLKQSEPEPDLVIARGGDETSFGQNHPGPAEIGVVIEVANTSLLLDREAKLPIYAGAEIPTYWIVNLPERQLEVYTQPIPGNVSKYTQCSIFKPGEFVPLMLDGNLITSIPVNDIFPR